MKIILTETELTDTLRKHYPVPPGYVVDHVAFKKQSDDFCTVSFEAANKSVDDADYREVASK